MATVEKRGDSYRITASVGYDITGRQIRARTTWTPSPGMTQRQIERELMRQSVLFEEEARQSEVQDSSIRLVDFTERFLAEYARPYLKARTSHTYAERMRTVNAALGHIKLRDLRPGHVAKFYQNLQEPGVHRPVWAICKMDLSAWMREHKTNMAAVSRDAGVSRWAVKQSVKKGKISAESAKKIAEFVGTKFSEAYTTQKDMTKLKPGTIHSYHRALSAVLGRAVKWKVIKENPCTCVDLPSIARRKAAYLDEDDARRLLELLHDEPIKWRAIVSFDLLSGLRRGELAGLRWQDVGLDSHIITVRQTANYLPDRGVYLDTPKTDESCRSVLLSASAVLLLLEYKEWQDAQRDALGDAWEDLDGRVFTSDTGAPLFPDSITQWVTRFIARSGLPKVTLHSLRHTYASLMIADGIPLVIIAGQLGHAQPSTTANIYGHIIKSAQAQAAQSLDRFSDVVARKKAIG